MRMMRLVVWGAVLATAALANALPVELRDQNNSRYLINTDVQPFENISNASGALTNATYVKPVTVTSYYIGFTPFFGFATVYTVQREVNVPLTNGFAGFNGLVVGQIVDNTVPSPRVFNPGEGLAAEECPQNGTNRQLVFQTQSFDDLGLQVTRKVFVPNNSDFVRWMNIVTNTGTAPIQVGVSLRGLLGAGSQTQITSTSSGNTSITTQDEWFTTAQQTASPNDRSLQPRLGFLVQGAGASAPATNVGINGNGQVAFTYQPTIQPGASAIILTYSSVQGNTKQAKKAMQDLVSLPSTAITCMTEVELAQVVNFPKLTPPVTKNATIKLKFKKVGADTVQWKGKINIGAGINLQGLPVSVDVGGFQQTFVLNKSGTGNNGGGNKFVLDATVKKGVTKAGNVKFSFNLKGDLQTPLAAYGLTNATVKNASVAVPVSFTAGPGHYGTDQPFTYTATAGKSGTGKTP
jgi:hypothetical protein